MRVASVVLRALLGLFAGFVVLDSARVALRLVADEGVAGALADGLSWQLAGSVLVLVPWCVWLLSRSEDRPPPTVGACLGVGAALVLASFFALRGRAVWAPWCIALAAFAPVAFALARRPRLRVAWTLLAALGWGAASLWGWIGSGYRWYPIPAAPPTPVEERGERWRQDLAYAESELLRLHVNALHTVSEDELRASFARLAARVDELTDLGIGAELAAIVTSIGDAHTGLSGYLDHVPSLPLRMRWMSDGLVLTHVPSEAPDVARLLGARVTHLAGVPVEELFDRVSAVIPHENRSWLLRQSPDYLLRPALLHVLGAIDDPGDGPVELRLAGGDAPPSVSFAVGVPSSLSTAFVKGRFKDRYPERIFWKERLKRPDVLYVRYRKCLDFLGFRSFAAEILAELESDPPERLILDLRGNTGGSSLQLSWFLLPGLRASAFNDPERLFLLIDRGTFSSGSGNAIEIDDQTEATLVGEATGGALNVYGEVRSFRLPGAGWHINYSTRFHPRRPGSGALSLEPEFVRVPSSEDWLANRDPALQLALEGLR
ncbi:MAG: hypothetical protein AAF682_24945 [Planctomycetota bacterium]